MLHVKKKKEDVKKRYIREKTRNWNDGLTSTLSMRIRKNKKAWKLDSK